MVRRRHPSLRGGSAVKAKPRRSLRRSALELSSLRVLGTSQATSGDLCIHHGNAIIKSPKGVLPDRVSSAPSNRDQIVPSVDMVHRGVALSAGRSAP
ncbi:hypothetical protein VUR80DRAFT_5256 [Thermomyces stellatus]